MRVSLFLNRQLCQLRNAKLHHTSCQECHLCVVHIFLFNQPILKPKMRYYASDRPPVRIQISCKTLMIFRSRIAYAPKSLQWIASKICVMYIGSPVVAGASCNTRYIPYPQHLTSDAIALIEIDKMCLFLRDPGNVLLLQCLLCHFVVCYKTEHKATQVLLQYHCFWIPFSKGHSQNGYTRTYRHVSFVDSCTT